MKNYLVQKTSIRRLTNKTIACKGLWLYFSIEIHCLQVYKKTSLKSSQNWGSEDKTIPQRCVFKEDWKQTSPTPQPCYTKRGSCFGPRGTTERREAALLPAPPLYSSAQEPLPMSISWHSQGCMVYSAYHWCYDNSRFFSPSLILFRFFSLLTMIGTFPCFFWHDLFRKDWKIKWEIQNWGEV